MMTDKPLYMMLVDDSWQRAHFALVFATGALSVGRTVTLFAGGRSVLALMPDWSGLSGVLPDSDLMARQVAGFGELRDIFVELKGVFMACEAGLALCGIDRKQLMTSAQPCGVVTFLAEAGDHPIITI